MTEVGGALRALGADPSTVDEVSQRLRLRLLVDANGVRRIAAYAGRAPLTRWIKVAAVRTYHKLGARDRLLAVGDDLSIGFAQPTSDSELEYLKQVHLEDFKDAVDAAVAGLAPAGPPASATCSVTRSSTA